MKSEAEVRQRIESWENSLKQLYPHPIIVEILGDIIAELNWALDHRMDVAKIASRIRRRTKQFDKAFAMKGPESTRLWILAATLRELRWTMNEDAEGAYREITWHLLTADLHDAECNLRKEGSDLILEGRGHPPDTCHGGRTFRFWLLLKNGRLNDTRLSHLSIEVIWLLYSHVTDNKFILTAQDDTQSGILEFTAEDFEFRFWEHFVPSLHWTTRGG